MTDITHKLLEIPQASVELCGLITAGGEILHVPNVHSEPDKGFRMEPQTLLNFMSNHDVVGTWHTHPEGDAALSQEDYAGFIQWPNLIHYIVGNGEVRAYIVENDLVLNA